MLSLKATRVELMHSDGPHPASPLFFFVCVYTYTYQARVNDEYGTHAPYHIYYSFLLLYIMETVMACCSYIESILPNTACRACCWTRIFIAFLHYEIKPFYIIMRERERKKKFFLVNWWDPCSFQHITFRREKRRVVNTCRGSITLTRCKRVLRA